MRQIANLIQGLERATAWLLLMAAVTAGWLGGHAAHDSGLGWLLCVVAAALSVMGTFLAIGLVWRLAGWLYRWPRSLLMRVLALRLKRSVRTALERAAPRQRPLDPAALHEWHRPWPGTAALDTCVQLLVVRNLDTAYGYLLVPLSLIVDARVRIEREAHTETKRSGRLAFGGVAGGVITAWSTGGRSRSRTRLLETASLEVQYLDEPASVMPKTAVIPFGHDQQMADRWCVCLRLQRDSRSGDGWPR